MKWDGHTHTKFCYHGHDAEQELYLEAAIEHGFERYSITEHSPLPHGWLSDEALMQEIAMPEEELPLYMSYASEMKREYEGRLDVTVGMEFDYLHGNQAYTERLIQQWEEQLEDVIYSVHYLPGVGGMRCIDYKPADFQEGLLTHYGTMERVVDAYYDEVEAAIAHAATFPMRTRIGHLNLIEKFQRVLPPIEEEQINERLRAILPKIKQAGIGVDVNTAGLRVPTCGKVYVPTWFIHDCLRQGIPCIYGSDAHHPKHVNEGWDSYQQAINL